MDSLADPSKLNLIAFVVGVKLDKYTSLVRVVQVICRPCKSIDVSLVRVKKPLADSAVLLVDCFRAFK